MSDLYSQTLRLLAERAESLQSVADGANVGYHWLAKLNQRQIPDPGVNRLQRVHDYLAQQSEKRKSESPPPGEERAA